MITVFSMNKLAQQLKKDVAILCKPQGRLVGSAGHRDARNYIIDRLRVTGIEPYKDDSYEFPYEYDGESFVNIAGIIRSGNSNTKPILIGAHYDSIIPAPCADDNAAAVAITLAVSEMLLQKKLDKDIIIAIYDAEEPPYFLSEAMGSVRFYEDHLKSHGVEAAIIMDLVGHDVLVPKAYVEGNGVVSKLAKIFPKQDGQDIAFPILRDMLFITGAESHPGMQNIILKTRIPNRLRILPTLNRYIGDMSDHGVFRSNNVPYLFLSCGRWRHYHMPTDTPEKLNYSKMARITQYLITLTNSLCQTTLPSIPCQEDDNMTVNFEIQSLKQACRPFFPFVLKYLGIKEFSSRKDIDELVSLLLSTGL